MNDINHLRRIQQSLLAEGVESWVFGGWAEELRGLRRPAPHNDIDLLIRDGCFGTVDRMIPSKKEFVEIPEKRFSHKRAFEHDTIRVELFLVHPETLTTDFFDGGHSFQWPSDTFRAGQSISGITVCSKSALQLYRSKHRDVMAGAHF